MTDAKPTQPPPAESDKKRAAREVIDILHELATILVRPPSPPLPSDTETAQSRANMS